jgi:outer membrane lipoprotein-sorting protein
LKEEVFEMVQKRYIYILFLILLSFLLWGCPKKVQMVPPEKVPSENPIAKLLEVFSSFDSLQAKASIRIDTVRDGEEMNFLLNGFLIYRKPGQFRLLGYHPLGMGLFDALYRNGEFFLLIPTQRKAYTGELFQFEDVMAKAGEIRIASGKEEGSDIPGRIRIELVEKQIRIELRLRGVTVNPPLPEESFQWNVPEGVEVWPIDRLLKGKKRR